MIDATDGLLLVILLALGFGGLWWLGLWFTLWQRYARDWEGWSSHDIDCGQPNGATHTAFYAFYDADGNVVDVYTGGDDAPR